MRNEFVPKYKVRALFALRNNEKFALTFFTATHAGDTEKHTNSGKNSHAVKQTSCVSHL